MPYEVDQLNGENGEKLKKWKWDSEGSTSARKCKMSMVGDTNKALLMSKKGGKKRENAESEDDGKADEDVSTSKRV